MTPPPQKLEKIGRYQVLEKVGKGGMGVLYRGFDPVLDREVAIKLMHADFSEDTEQMRPRFYREARAAAKLQHRNIVTIFEFAEESNVPYIVMEFLRGTPLGARLNAQPPLTLDDKLNVVAQLCDGLSYAHEQGVVHRDVKPDNVFLLEDGSVKLLDFGIAKLTSSTLTRQGDVLGSASYMSPEQVGGSESVDGRADIFSAGVMLYELLSGRKPFEGDSPTAVILKILKEDPTPIESLVSGLPVELVTIVNKALAKDPAERSTTADAFGRELQNLRKSLHPSMSAVRMDETRFASTQVLKALHEDYQKSKAGTPAARAAGDTVSGRAGATAHADAPVSRGRGWMMPAGVAAAVLVAAVGYFGFSRGPAPATTAGSSSMAALKGSSPGPGDSAASPTPPVATPPAPSAAPAGAARASATPPGAVASATPPAVAPLTGAPVAAIAKPNTLPAGSVPAAKPSAEPKKPAATPAPAAAAPSSPPAPAPAPAALVNVTLTGGYPFEVVDGSRTISPAATSHELKLPAGRTLQLRAPTHFLNQTVRVEGTVNQPFEFGVPGLGSLDVRSVQETCEVVIGNRKLGNPPLVVKEVAAGSYKVDLVCGTEVVKSHYATVRAGQTYVAAIR